MVVYNEEMTTVTSCYRLTMNNNEKRDNNNKGVIMVREPSQIRSSTPFLNAYDPKSRQEQDYMMYPVHVHAAQDEETIKKKNIQIKKLAKAFYLLQQEKKAQDDYVLQLEGDNYHLKETVEQQKLLLEANGKKLAKAHEKLMQREEGYVEKLEEQVSDLSLQKEKHFIPQIKQLQRQKGILDKKNLMQRKQIAELKEEMGNCKLQMKKMIESNERENLLSVVKELEASNLDLHTMTRELRKQLLKKSDECRKKQERIEQLQAAKESIEAEYEQKKVWNNQIQLYYAEKREQIDHLKREKGTLKRQLRRETKRGLKREVVVNKLIDESSKIRKAHEVEQMKPVTVVEHIVDPCFFKTVKRQLTEMTRELQIELKRDKPFTTSIAGTTTMNHSTIAHSEQKTPSVSSISSGEATTRMFEELHQPELKNLLKGLQRTNKKQVGEMVFFTEEFNAPPSTLYNVVDESEDEEEEMMMMRVEDVDESDHDIHSDSSSSQGSVIVVDHQNVVGGEVN